MLQQSNCSESRSDTVPSFTCTTVSMRRPSSWRFCSAGRPPKACCLDECRRSRKRTIRLIKTINCMTIRFIIFIKLTRIITCVLALRFSDVRFLKFVLHFAGWFWHWGALVSFLTWNIFKLWWVKGEKNSRNRKNNLSIHGVLPKLFRCLVDEAPCFVFGNDELIMIWDGVRVIFDQILVPWMQKSTDTPGKHQLNIYYDIWSYMAIWLWDFFSHLSMRPFVNFGSCNFWEGPLHLLVGHSGACVSRAFLRASSDQGLRRVSKTWLAGF